MLLTTLPQWPYLLIPTLAFFDAAVGVNCCSPIEIMPASSLSSQTISPIGKHEGSLLRTRPRRLLGSVIFSIVTLANCAYFKRSLAELQKADNPQHQTGLTALVAGAGVGMLHSASLVVMLGWGSSWLNQERIADQAAIMLSIHPSFLNLMSLAFLPKFASARANIPALSAWLCALPTVLLTPSHSLLQWSVMLPAMLVRAEDSCMQHRSHDESYSNSQPYSIATAELTTLLDSC